MAKVIGDIVSIQKPKSGSGGGGGNIAIDNAMSDTSENAVQNKVIKTYIDEHDVVGITTQKLEIEKDRTGKKYVDRVCIDDAKTHPFNLKVTVGFDNWEDASNCRLEFYLGLLIEPSMTYSPSQVENGIAVFEFKVLPSYGAGSDDYYIKVVWTDIPVSTSCIVELTYPRKTQKVIEEIKTSIENVKEKINSVSEPFTIAINNDNVGDKTYLEIAEAIDNNKTIKVRDEVSGFNWDVIGIQKQADRVLIGCHFDYTTLWLWCTPENEWGALSKEYASKSDIGDIDTALDTIIEIQNTLIGGDGE